MANKIPDLFFRNIVIISPEGWGKNLLSKHHIALTLARRNNKVWFVHPPDLSAPSSVSIHPNITLVSHRPVFGINRLPAVLARLVARIEVKRLQKKINAPIDVVWSFDPFQLQFLKLFDAGITIYHPVDNHYTTLEDRVVSEADFVFTNADDTLSRIHHRNKHKIGHGVASYFLEMKTTITLPGDFAVKAGYVGNLNNRLFDFDRFISLVKSHPDVGFYLIGPRGSSNLSSSGVPVFDWTAVEDLPNVFLLGQQPSSLIPSYLSAMDILLVLYKPDEKGFTANAHKLLEYLSSGKIVIAPAHKENAPIKHLIVQPKTLSELPDAFDNVLKNIDRYKTDEQQALRIKSAASMTYEHRLTEIDEIIKNTLKTL